MQIIIIIAIAVLAFFIVRAIRKSSQESKRMNNHNKYIEKMNLGNDSEETPVIKSTVANESSTDDSLSDQEN